MLDRIITNTSKNKERKETQARSVAASLTMHHLSCHSQVRVVALLTRFARIKLPFTSAADSAMTESDCGMSIRSEWMLVSSTARCVRGRLEVLVDTIALLDLLCALETRPIDDVPPDAVTLFRLALWTTADDSVFGCTAFSE